MFKTVLIFCLSLLLQIFPSHARAQTAGDSVVLVLDGSNSMWGRIDGTAKIAIAGQVLADMLAAWPPQNDLGLVAYGHREEGNCNDIETLVGLGPFDAAALGDAVSGVTPRGKTPLTDAVRHAVTLFTDASTTGRIVLLTDGLETCAGDPCALGRELAAQGVDLQVHIVGFDLAGRDVSPLQCLADETGGTYRDAADAGQLSSALNEGVQQASLQRNVTFRALDGDGRLLDRDVQWTVYPDDRTNRSVANMIAPEAAIALPPGDYRVVALLGDVTLQSRFEIVEGEPELVALTFATGTINLTAILTEGGDPLTQNLEWDVASLGDPDEDEIATEAGDAVSFTLMAGTYQGFVRSDDLDVPFELVIVGGRTHDLAVDLNAGIVAVTGLGPGGAPTDRHVSWSLYPPDSNGRGRPLAREVRRETSFLVAAGSYLLVGDYMGEAIGERIELAPGATLERGVTFAEP